MKESRSVGRRSGGIPVGPEGRTSGPPWTVVGLPSQLIPEYLGLSTLKFFLRLHKNFPYKIRFSDDRLFLNTLGTHNRSTPSKLRLVVMTLENFNLIKGSRTDGRWGISTGSVRTSSYDKLCRFEIECHVSVKVSTHTFHSPRP